MKQESKLAWVYRVIIPKATSLGASIVVLGALFKIQHFPGAGIFLAIGLITESVIFLMGVFEPSPPFHLHYNWENVHPELIEDAPKAKPKSEGKGLLALGAIDKMLQESNLSPNVMKKFGEGMKKLETTSNQMKDMTSVVSASNTYTKSLETASTAAGKVSQSVGQLSQSLQTTSKSFDNIPVNTIAKSMDGVSKGFQQYSKEITTNAESMKKNAGELAALNGIYEMQRKSADGYLKSMNKYSDTLKGGIESMSTVSRDAQSISKEMGRLSNNLVSLNKVYGNMLSAMKS